MTRKRKPEETPADADVIVHLVAMDRKITVRFEMPQACASFAEAEVVFADSIHRIDSALSRTPRTAGQSGNLRSKREVLHQELRAAGASLETVAGFYRTLAEEIECRVLRKDVTAMVPKIAARLPKRASDYVLSPFQESSVRAIRVAVKTVEDPWLLAKLVALEAKYARRLPPTEEVLDAIIAEIYEQDPREPLHKRGAAEDIAWLKKTFWRDGAPCLVRKEHRRPQQMFWGLFRGWTVALLRSDIRSAPQAADLVGRLLRLHLVETGLLPLASAFSLGPAALRVAERRWRAWLKLHSDERGRIDLTSFGRTEAPKA